MNKTVPCLLVFIFTLPACSPSKVNWQKVNSDFQMLWNDLTIHEESDPSDLVIAIVGGSEIRASDLQDRFRVLPTNKKAQFYLPAGKRELLERQINFMLLVNEARTASLKDDLQSQKDLKSRTDSVLINWFTKRLKETTLFISEDEVRNFYASHAGKLPPRIEIRASRLIFKSLDDAQKTRATIKRKSFEETFGLASTRASSAIRAEKMPPFYVGEGDPAVERGIASLSVGQVSDIVPSPIGYQLIRVDKRQTLPSQTLKEADKQIRALLERQKFKQWTLRVRSSSRIRINEEAFNKAELIKLPQNPPKTSR